jgi:hypothetical protein
MKTKQKIFSLEERLCRIAEQQQQLWWDLARVEEEVAGAWDQARALLRAAREQRHDSR